jgi:hypothetical protein
MKLHRFFITVVILFVAMPHVSGQNSTTTEVAAVPYEDPDAYAVYSVLLASQNGKFFVIQSELEYFPNGSSSGVEGGAEFKKLWGVAVEDYVRQFRQKRSLVRNFSLDAPYQLLPKAEIMLAFKLPPGTTPQPGEGWVKFYSKYPEARGYYYLSAVGFDENKTHAIVQMNNWCGMLCGGGYSHFFEKVDGNWHEITVKASIRGWAS